MGAQDAPCIPYFPRKIHHQIQFTGADFGNGCGSSRGAGSKALMATQEHMLDNAARDKRKRRRERGQARGTGNQQEMRDCGCGAHWVVVLGGELDPEECA